MSQVIVTEDTLRVVRQQTQSEERKIVRFVLPVAWRRSDATHTLVIERILAIAVLPVVAVLALVMICAWLGMVACLGLFYVGNRLFRRR